MPMWSRRGESLRAATLAMLMLASITGCADSDSPYEEPGSSTAEASLQLLIEQVQPDTIVEAKAYYSGYIEKFVSLDVQYMKDGKHVEQVVRYGKLEDPQTLEKVGYAGPWLAPTQFPMNAAVSAAEEACPEETSFATVRLLPTGRMHVNVHCSDSDRNIDRIDGVELKPFPERGLFTRKGVDRLIDEIHYAYGETGILRGISVQFSDDRSSAYVAMHYFSLQGCDVYAHRHLEPEHSDPTYMPRWFLTDGATCYEDGEGLFLDPHQTFKLTDLDRDLVVEALQRAKKIPGVDRATIRYDWKAERIVLKATLSNPQATDEYTFNVA